MNKCLCFCLLLVLASCAGSNTNDKPTDAPAPKIEDVNFYMEVSGSMAGYLRGATDFAKTVPNLLVAIEQQADSGRLPLHTYYIGDSIVRFKGSTEEFIYTIATQQPAREKSSQMHRIFQQIANHTDSNDIAMFVSDCILSYSDEDIKNNKEINREKAEAGLKPFITSAFNQLQRKNNMAASLYGFSSSFNGTYYTYQNGRIPIRSGQAMRPYYIWVIGNKELLKHFNSQLYKLESFNPDLLAMHFGLFDKPVSDYEIFFRYKKSGEWQPEGGSIKDLEATKKEPATIAIGANLSALPPYAQDTAYLLHHLKLDKATADYEIKNIQPANAVDKSELKRNELDALSNATHILVLQVNEVYKSNAALLLSLPLQYDTTYRRLSVMDDRSVATMAGKTFGLEHLVDGVRAAYQNPNQHFINISIPVKK